MSSTENKKMKENPEQNDNEDSKQIKYLAGALLLIIIVLAGIMLLRLSQDKPLLPSGESYYNLRMAQALEPEPLLIVDPVQGTPYEPQPYHYLLAFLLKFMPVQTLSFILPLIMGTASALLFFRLLLRLGIKYKIASYALVILAVTPGFVVLFTGLYVTAFIIFLSLLISYILFNCKKNYYLLSLCVLLFLLLGLTSLTGLTLASLGFLFMCFVLKKKLRLLLTPLIPTLIAIALLAIVYKYQLRLSGFHAFEFRSILSVLQASLGFDVFLLVLFFTGFIIVWNTKEERRFLQLVMLAFLGVAFFNSIALAFVSFAITIYCVIAINFLYQRKWELEIIRTGTLLLVLCSLVFSATNQLNIIVNSQPDKNMQDALLMLNGFSKGKVLTSEENGFLVEYYAKKNVLLDSNSFRLQNSSQLKKIQDTLFSTVRLTDAYPLMQNNSIHYVLITPEMKNDIWEGRQQGLWFLMKNSETFYTRHSKAGIEIWEYTPVY